MDTGTHVVMGIGLAGLSTLDPAIGQNPSLFSAVAIGVIVGSQAPDIDTVLKLKNNAVYLKNHRGVTHSIPAQLLWPTLITLVLLLFFPNTSVPHLWGWTMLAVFLHVFVDIFNAYGTQALRPFSEKWVALGWINTFDAFIFGAHIVGILLWLFNLADPGPTFVTIYAGLILYYIVRGLQHRQIVRAIHRTYPHATKWFISPRMSLGKFRVAVSSDDHFYVGTYENGKLHMVDQFNRLPFPDKEWLHAAKEDENVSAFLSFSPSYRWEIDKNEQFVEIRFIDNRYRSKGHYPFVAVVQLDWDLDVLCSYTGWVFREETLQKKLSERKD
ncbi:metal-dependent hydrolase [Bacillus fonticola]|uniref:metal-dependent hydrolase n=1 Tax=Bacillus fonticola TaxID=2728853 RepID=UPI001475DE6A|nr:metal-dependent hydrolase [Bacillus fonticola]